MADALFFIVWIIEGWITEVTLSLINTAHKDRVTSFHNHNNFHPPISKICADPQMLKYVPRMNDSLHDVH